MHGALTTLTTIRKWFRKPIDTKCPMCGVVEETGPHIFLCSYWINVWSAVKIILNKYHPSLRYATPERLIIFDVKSNCKLVTTLFLLTLHFIFKARNEAVIEKLKVNPETVYYRIVQAFKKKIIKANNIQHSCVSI